MVNEVPTAPLISQMTRVGFLHFHLIYYQDILQKNQARVWQSMEQTYSLRWDKLRKFMLYGFSDAATLEYSAKKS